MNPATAPVTNRTIIAQAIVTLTIFEVSGLLRGSPSERPLVATCDAVAVLVSVGSIKTGVLACVLDISIGAIAKTERLLAATNALLRLDCCFSCGLTVDRTLTDSCGSQPGMLGKDRTGSRIALSEAHSGQRNRESGDEFSPSGDHLEVRPRLPDSRRPVAFPGC